MLDTPPAEVLAGGDPGLTPTDDDVPTCVRAMAFIAMDQSVAGFVAGGLAALVLLRVAHS